MYLGDKGLDSLKKLIESGGTTRSRGRTTTDTDGASRDYVDGKVADLLAKVNQEIADREQADADISDALQEEVRRATAEEQRLAETKADKEFITDTMINGLD